MINILISLGVLSKSSDALRTGPALGRTRTCRRWQVDQLKMMQQDQRVLYVKNESVTRFSREKYVFVKVSKAITYS